MTVFRDFFPNIMLAIFLPDVAESICFLIEDGEQLARQLAYEKSIDTMEEVGHCLDPSEATALEQAEIRKRLLPYFLQLPEYRHLIEVQPENK